MHHLGTTTRRRTWRGILVGMILGAFLMGCDLIDLSSSNTPPASTPTVALTPTPTPEPDWITIEDGENGYRLDIPGVLSGEHPTYINDFSGQLAIYQYSDKPLASPFQKLEAETIVQLSYSTKITDTNICPIKGTLLTLPSGIKGRQETDAPPHPTSPPGFPFVTFSTVIGGVAIQIELDGAEPLDTFFTRYGTIWQHMLDSLAPIPSVMVHHTHPCG